MGNWHCIPSSCATVHYREYEPPKIRWRYDSEPWQEIEGDDYLLARSKGQCNTGYLLRGRFEAAYEFGCRQIWEWYSNPNLPVPGVILGFEERIISGQTRWVILYQRPNQSAPQVYTNLIDTFYRTEFRNRVNCSRGGAFAWTGGFFSIDSITRVDGQLDNCGDCVFTITKNGQTLYTETRAVCPEVQKIPCSLSTVEKQIEIKKLPYLERIEIRDQSINTVFVSPLEAPLLDTKPLPLNCYNVYKTYILAPPLLSNFVPLPGVVNPYQYVTQICSAPGCPPPEYQVICDCNNCESCPSGTCPIECDGQICCYNDYGISVAQIPISNYCGGNS